MSELLQPTEANHEFINAMMRERQYQIDKWGHNGHTVGEWVLIAGKELEEALDAWVHHKGDDAALAELLQVATVIMACFEQHDIVERDHDAGTGGAE